MRIFHHRPSKRRVPHSSRARVTRASVGAMRAAVAPAWRPPRACRRRCRFRRRSRASVLAASSSGVTSYPVDRGVSLESFVEAASMAWEDERTASNPSGWCDLSRAESRLLDGYDTSGVGVERRAPSSGADLRRCVADLLVDAGFGAPWANGWLDPSWVSFLRGAEAEAIESVVAAALRVSERPGVIVLAPYRPGWPSPSGCVRAVPDAAVALVDPAHPAHDGDILDALNAAEAHLHVDVGAVVLGNPSPATGVTADAAVALAASRWCESRGAHLVADETAAAAVVVRPDDDDDDASPRGASAPSLNPTPTPTKPSWGRAAGYASSTSLWRKARASESGWSPHAVTAFGAAGGYPTRKDELRAHHPRRPRPRARRYGPVRAKSPGALRRRRNRREGGVRSSRRDPSRAATARARRARVARGRHRTAERRREDHRAGRWRCGLDDDASARGSRLPFGRGFTRVDRPSRVCGDV